MEKLKSNEVRVGNLVMYNNQDYILSAKCIEQIEQGKIICYPIELTRERFLNMGFKPIFHEVEWTLEEKQKANECVKNGFPIQKREKTNFIYYYHFPISGQRWVIPIRNETKYAISVFNFENYISIIKYFHQLQNIYFSCYHKELISPDR